MLIRNDIPRTDLQAAQAVASFLATRFVYVPDPPIPGGDYWPAREEIEDQIIGTGQLRGDCDDHAFAAVYALDDLGVKARVVLCWVETGAYHAVAQTLDGYVICNRRPGMVETWETLRYRPDRMSGFFCQNPEEIALWHMARFPA